MQARTRAPSRAGLAGNPSDAYGGRALAVAVERFEAWAAIEPARGFRLTSAAEGSLELALPFPLPTPGAGHELAVAACRTFLAAARRAGWLDEARLSGEGFHLRYGSSIPRGVGLAGSSGLAVAVLRALAIRYETPLSERDLPSLALAVETDELGIHGGLMDRVAQVLGGLVYMDLDDGLVRATGAGRYETLEEDRLPALYLAWDDRLASGSGTVHNDLRQRYERGEPDVLAIVADLASLADEARGLLVAGRGEDLPRLMDANFELRARLLDVGPGNRRLVAVGRAAGAGVKQAGSGGAVVGAFDGDPDRLAALRSAYEAEGARFMAPLSGVAPAAGRPR